MEKEIISAIIAAGTSIATVLIIKPIVDKYLHKFQLKQNYISDQSRKIKDVLAHNKSGLLKSGELLNNRLKNFAKNHGERWLNCCGDYYSDRHYIDTTVYRLLSFYAHIKIIERNLIYLDTTISQKSDLRLLKYFRIFHEVLCDVDLYNGFDYDIGSQTDHFFTTPFDNMVNHVICDNRIIDLDDFLKKKKDIMPKIIALYQFFDDINPHENRLRCERLKSLHLILIAFLNEFGYDYQKTDKLQLQNLRNRLGEYKLILNLQKLIEKYKLNEYNGQLEKVIKQINKKYGS